MLTVHLAPDEIVLVLSVEFSDRLTTTEIEQRVAELEEALRAKHPEIITVFVKPESHDQFGQFRAEDD